MRVGVMVGPERGFAERKVSGMIADIEWAEGAGMDSAWIPQLPSDFDAFLALVTMGCRSSRIELGTAVVPFQAQHPIALARQALSAQALVGDRVTLGVGPSHDWIVQGMLGLPYDRPAAYTRDYLEILGAAVSGRESVDIENSTFSVHNPIDLGGVSPVPILLAALGPVMLRHAGEFTDGTILWMADERAVDEHVIPRITKAAYNAGRASPRVVAGIPVCLCLPAEADAARQRANAVLGYADQLPNYRRMLSYGDAGTVGDLCVVGDEAALLARFRRFADVGVTDLAVRVLPIGADRDQLVASKHRTRDAVAALAAELR